MFTKSKSTEIFLIYYPTIKTYCQAFLKEYLKEL